MDIGEMTEKMREYFQRCTDSGKGQDGKSAPPKSKREIASLAGLAQHLGCFKEDILAKEGGTPEERLFYKDMLQRFEICVDEMYVASTIDKDAYKALKTQMFAISKGDDTSRNIVLTFPDWHAPDDWEKYKEFKGLVEKHGISWYRAYELLDDAIEELSKHAR